jgi:hypothetical protein
MYVNHQTNNHGRQSRKSNKIENQMNKINIDNFIVERKTELEEKKEFVYD